MLLLAQLSPSGMSILKEGIYTRIPTTTLVGVNVSVMTWRILFSVDLVEQSNK